MNFLTIFVVTEFLGNASCGFVCMQIKLKKCFTEMFYSGPPICTDHTTLTRCISIGAKACGTESEPIVKEMIKTYTDTCTEGTEMNKMFQKHQECAFGTYSPVYFKCYEDYRNEISKLGIFTYETTDDRIEVLKVYCKYDDAITLCCADILNRICGPETVEYKRRLQAPSTKLLNEVCILIQNVSNGISTNRSVAMNNDSEAEEESKGLLARVALDNDSQNEDRHKVILSSVATATDSQNFFHILAVIFLLKCFSDKYA